MSRTHHMLAYPVAVFVATAGPTWSEEVATTYDEEWISLSGTVEAVLASSFMLDYGEDDITVELDKFNWAVERSVLQDKQVTVTGRLDRNLYDNRTIEASIVHVPSLNEYIFADPSDEEGDPWLARSFAPGLFSGAEEGDWLTFSGRVTGVDGDEIMVDTGVSALRVDVSPVPGDLMPASVEVGDRVLVTGEMDTGGLFDKREVEASAVARMIESGT